MRASTSRITCPLTNHLENHFQLDRGAERKACDAIHQATRALVFSEDVLQQLRSGVSDFRLIADISRSGHRHAEPDDPRHFVERSQCCRATARMLSAARWAALRPASTSSSAPTRPMNFAPWPSVGSIPLRKNRLPVCTAST